MNTWFLNPTTWDLALDSNGSIAMATNPYALAQDAASAIKTFLGEVYYDTTQGVPYWQQILGTPPSVPVIVAQLQKAALTVPEVVAAQVFITGFDGTRNLSGQVQVTNESGVIAVASFQT
jgi:hypothetical protein